MEDLVISSPTNKHFFVVFLHRHKSNPVNYLTLFLYVLYLCYNLLKSLYKYFISHHCCFCCMQMIPAEFFATHVEGKSQSTKLKLTSDASDKTWEVNLDGRRLARGWEDFSIVHALRDDDVLIFKYNGDMTFHITASGRSFCKLQCISSDEDDTWDEYSNSKKKLRTEAESSSKNSYLVAHVTSSNLSRDRLVST